MMKFNRMPRLFALALAGLLAFAGCSELPTAPLESVSVGDGSSSTSTESTGGALEAGTTTTGTTTTSTPLALTNTRVINGLLGGTVRAGNFTVIFPPAAFSGKASVTVSQPDASRPIVELSITPASANKFLLPVLLVADARPMDRSLLSVSYISYYNPTKAQWERVANSSVSVLNLTVTAPLWHFSKYRVDSGGKAGW